MTTDTGLAGNGPLLHAILNLTTFHREHEKFYASSPRELAVALQRHARTLQALADQWAGTQPSSRSVLSPYEGTEDLNSAAALQLDGVLFMEGEDRPPELTHLIRDLRAAAADQAGIGEWLGQAMQASWDMAATLAGIGGLAGVLGERHRIIANDWQAAGMTVLLGRILDRAADILELVDFTPQALRADLAGERLSAARLYSAAELISHAADLCCDSAGLVHDNVRRWRLVGQQVSEVLAAADGGDPAARP